MAKPVIDKIPAFDSNYDYTLTFTCYGLQPNYNEVFIYDNNDLTEPVYHKLEASMRYDHTIKAEKINTTGTVTPVVDIEVFSEAIDKASGNYYFQYISGSWVHDGENVNLADYGIIVEESAEGDYFYVLYTPPSGLQNGKQYKIVIKCYGYDYQIESSLSDPVWFNCFTTPVLSFQGIDSSTVTQVNDSSLEVSLQYTQLEGEHLKSFQFKLLNSEKIEIKESESFYSLTNNNFIYTMLNDNTSYWIEAVGYTEYDTQVKVLANIYVKYIRPVVHSIIRVEPEDGTGIVTYYTDIRIVNPERDDYDFIEDNYIDLRGDSIDYKTGFTIQDDYTLIIKLQEGYLGEIAKILAGDHISKLECIEVGDDVHCRYKFTAYDAEGFEYILYSQELTMMTYNINNPVTTIVIQRNNSLYDLFVLRGGLTQ